MSLIPSKMLGDLRSRAAAALERADELGGDLRDYLKDRWEHDPRLARLKSQVGKLAGKAPAAKPAQASGTGGTKAANAAAIAATAAAPLAPPKPAAPTGMGKPEIPAQIYGKKSCPWTGRAITILERLKVDYDFVDIEEPEHEKLALPLSNETKQHTVPYVYLRGHFIGGFNALAEVERLGQLDYLLLSAEDKAKAPAHVRRVEIAARPNTDEIAPAELDPAAPE